MARLANDLRIGFRSLFRKPGFTAVALSILAFGIGSNTAIFTLLDAVFFNPLDVEDGHELVSIYATTQPSDGKEPGLLPHSHANYLDIRDRNQVLSTTAMYQMFQVNLSGGSVPVRLMGMVVSGNYFEVLGVRPAHGRFFQPEEYQVRGTHPVAVLSYSSWAQVLGADPDLIGQSVNINGRSFTVIGIAPKQFKGTRIDSSAEVWIPSTMYKEISPYADYFDMREAAMFWVFGRLKPEVTLKQAEIELKEIARQLREEFPEKNADLDIGLSPLVEGTIFPTKRGRYVSFGGVLMLAVGMILVISCLNLAKLLLVRGMDRSREIAVRLAVGAERSHLVRQLFTESFLLFFLGGILSLPVARWSLDMLWSLRPPEFAASAVDLSLDVEVLGFALAVTLLCSLLFGLVPMFQASRPDVVASLKAVRMPSRRSSGRARGLLIVAQVTLAQVVLIVAGLFLQSLNHAQNTDLGFETDNLIVMGLAPGDLGYGEDRARSIYRQVLEHSRSLPGVRAAALSHNRLLHGSTRHGPIFLAGQDEPLQGDGLIYHRINAVSPGFFEAVGIPILKGRDFGGNDRHDTTPVAIINETMAKIVWPGADAIGRSFLFAPDGAPIEVVGVARDAKYRYVYEDPQFFIYLPLSQSYVSSMTLHVRTVGDPQVWLETLRREAQALDPNLPLTDLSTMSRVITNALWLERMLATLLNGFGALALVLATIGLYGVLAYSVRSRQREIGIRMAHGASRSRVVGSVLAEAAAVVGIGIASGWVLTFFLVAPTISGQLHGPDARDLLTYLAPSLLLLAAALMGGYVPARRAARTDPVAVLRLD